MQHDQVMSLRNVDLNLLVTLDALLRERHVTRAAHLQGMSQPAMSGALARLRDMFSDELLVRIGQEYQLTPLARDLVDPLQAGLATLRAVLARQSSFDPQTSTREFKIAASDYTLSVLGPKLLRHFAEVAPSLRLHLRVADAASASKLASGQLDLSIQPHGVVPDMPAEVLFKDSWVCAAWSGNESISDPITLEEWSSLPHACFSFGCGSMVMTDLLLGPLAEVRKRQVVSESFLAIPLILPGTRLIAMLPSQIAELLKSSADIRLVEPPKHIPPFSETMTWSSLCDLDPAHVWLRQQLKLVATHDMPAVCGDVHALRNGSSSLAI
jgi:DNA-binding transcriptional LysR family regulator